MAGKHKTRSLKWVCARKVKMTSESATSKRMWRLIENQIGLGMRENIRIKINETGIYSTHYSQFISDEGEVIKWDY